MIGRNDELRCLSTVAASSANSTMDLGLSTLILTGRSGRSPSAMTASRGKILFNADGGGGGDNNKLASPLRGEGGGGGV